MSLKVAEYLADSIIKDVGNQTVYDLMEETLKNDYTEDEEKELLNILDEVLIRMGVPEITEIQTNCAIYAQNQPDDIKKFYKWVNVNLDRLRRGEKTLQEFFELWTKARPGIIKKADSPKLSVLTKLGLVNMVIFVEDMVAEQIKRAEEKYD